MPLDLVGKLHRTVYITDCPDDSYEDLVRLLLQRCGAVEAWDVVDGRVIVVFQSLNSVSNALSFHGMSFVNLATKIAVWRATEPPPAAARQQLAIAQKGDAADVAPEDSEEAEEQRQRQMVRRERRAALQQLLKQNVELSDTVNSPERRQQRLQELCWRQLKALDILTKNALKEAKAELAAKQMHLDRLRELVESTKARKVDHQPTEPPLARQRMELRH